MKLTLKNTLLRIDLPMLLFPCIASLLGEGRLATLLMISLTAHELAHIYAARCVHVGITSIRLTPFGGIAQMDSFYTVSPLRIAVIAAAGPSANLLLTIFAAALCHWSLLPPALSLELVEINLTLMLFNLLPALPLDGGRILWARLSVRLSRERSLRISILLGRILAGLLATLAIIGFLTFRMLNLSLLFASLFIFISAKDDLQAMALSRIQMLLRSSQRLSHPTTAELIAIDASTAPQDALKAAHADRIPIFAIFENGRLYRFTDAQSLVSRLSYP